VSEPRVDLAEKWIGDRIQQWEFLDDYDLEVVDALRFTVESARAALRSTPDAEELRRQRDEWQRRYEQLADPGIEVEVRSTPEACEPAPDPAPSIPAPDELVCASRPEAECLPTWVDAKLICLYCRRPMPSPRE